MKAGCGRCKEAGSHTIGQLESFSDYTVVVGSRTQNAQSNRDLAQAGRGKTLTNSITINYVLYTHWWNQLDYDCIQT